MTNVHTIGSYYYFPSISSRVVNRHPSIAMSCAISISFMYLSQCHFVFLHIVPVVFIAVDVGVSDWRQRVTIEGSYNCTVVNQTFG